MEPFTVTQIQSLIKRQLETLKTAAIYSVDTLEKLQYVRGQIRSLEDLQQDLKDLLKKVSDIDE